MPDPAPVISVVIPAYNRAHMLPVALDSVLAQEGVDLEVVVVDDGSQDDTERVMAGYVKEHGARVRYVRQDNAGASAARNHGVELAAGEFIAFLDSDDLFLPGKLAAQLAAFRAHPHLGLVATDYRVTTMDGEFVRPGAISARPLGYRALLIECPLATPTVMVRRKALAEVGPFDTRMHLCEDLDLWCRVARRFPVACLPRCYCVVRTHGAGTSRDPGEIAESWLYLARKHLAAAPELEPRYRRRLLGTIHRTTATRYDVVGRLWSWPALRHLVIALWLQPPIPRVTWRPRPIRTPALGLPAVELPRVTPALGRLSRRLVIAARGLVVGFGKLAMGAVGLALPREQRRPHSALLIWLDAEGPKVLTADDAPVAERQSTTAAGQTVPPSLPQRLLLMLRALPTAWHLAAAARRHGARGLLVLGDDARRVAAALLASRMTDKPLGVWLPGGEADAQLGYALSLVANATNCLYVGPGTPTLALDHAAAHVERAPDAAGAARQFRAVLDPGSGLEERVVEEPGRAEVGRHRQ